MRQWREIAYRCAKGVWCTHKFTPWQKVEMPDKKIRHCLRCGRTEFP